MTKTDHSFVDRRPIAILQAGAILAPLTAYSMLGAAERGGFSPACARLDLSAATIIEARGKSAGTPTPWLANAGLAHLQARMLCGAGEEEKGHHPLPPDHRRRHVACRAADAVSRP